MSISKIKDSSGTVHDIATTIANVSGLQAALDGKAPSTHNHSASQITSGTIAAARLPAASGTAAGITIVYPASECSTFTSDAGACTPAAVKKAVSSFAITKESGGTITNNSAAQKDEPSIKWKKVGDNTPYIGFATDQSDGTFVFGSLTGTEYRTGLAIGGGSGNLLWKGARVATADDIASHNHSASQITSGTLPIARGGTGATTAADALTNLGAVGRIDTTNSATNGGTGEIFNSYDGDVKNVASGDYSHAEGALTYATEDTSVAPTIIVYTDASAGICAHAEGYGTVACGAVSHAEGTGTKASGNYSHAEGYNTTASEYAAHAEGRITTASGNASHAEGMSTTASGLYSHAEGYFAKATGDKSHAEGDGSESSGRYSHAEGYYTKASGNGSHTEGQSTTASGTFSHAEGQNTTASGWASHAQGKYNKAMNNNSSQDSTAGDAMVIGNGTYISETGATTLSNAFRVTFAGKAYGLSSFGSSGADYAEFFEWEDGNELEEDRVGYFVTMNGNHISKANPNDYILGVVSGEPCIIGNSDEDWLGRWEHDEFGRFIKEDVDSHVTELKEVEVEILDKDGNPTGETKTELKEVETGEIIHGWRYKANPDYDSTQEYIERKDRKEWDAVGMLGVLSVRDDGTCEVNGYAKVAQGGIATKAESYIHGMTYRVIKRMSDNVVQIVFR